MGNGQGPDSVKGLKVKVEPSGYRSYFVYYICPAGKPTHWVLGPVGEMTLAEARDGAADARRLARKKLDPRAGDPRKTLIFKACVEDYTRLEAQGSKGLSRRSAISTSY